MRLSFLTLQRGNAVGEAPRHRSAPRHRFRIGRGASHDSWDYRSSHSGAGTIAQGGLNGCS
ncbi:DUF1534 domain-containing protein [Pseudomonas syringae]|nr:DUF1534 domain-containing protein [Pseudomonas syringae]